MTQIQKWIESNTSDTDWAIMAGHAGISAEDLKAKIISAFAEDSSTADPGERSNVALIDTLTLGERRMEDVCYTQHFDATLLSKLGVKGSLTACPPSATHPWSAELNFALIVAGVNVWEATYTFGPHNLSVCFNPHVSFASAELCFSVSAQNGYACLSISGSAQVGWGSPHSFNQQLFCLPIPGQ